MAFPRSLRHSFEEAINYVGLVASVAVQEEDFFKGVKFDAVLKSMAVVNRERAEDFYCAVHLDSLVSVAYETVYLAAILIHVISNDELSDERTLFLYELFDEIPILTYGNLLDWFSVFAN